MRKFRQLTHDDRVVIDALFRAGHSKKEVAELTGFHISTIYREYKRGECMQVNSELVPYMVYSFMVADAHHDEVFSHKGAPVKLDSKKELVPLLEELIIEQRFSPGAASAILRRRGGPYVSENTIYRYIGEKRFPRLRRHHLPEKGIRKHPRPKEAKKVPRYGTSIENRPAVIAERSMVGHWEGDSIVGKLEGQGESCLAFTERKSLLELVFKVPRKAAAETVAVLDLLDVQCDFQNVFQSITFDNGSEFAHAERIETSPSGQKRTTAYYCHPYTSCERPQNENANRLLRRWLPKGKSMKNVTQEQVLAITRWMNNYPRQSLGWRTPAEVFLEECRKQGIKISPEFSQYLS